KGIGVRLLAFAITCVFALNGPGFAKETPASQLFSAVGVASTQTPEAIGGYSRGCGAGLEQLPETGPTWQAMRLSRNRNWGHPETIGYLIDLSQAATKVGWRGLYIGDISQPRGGPSPSGHVSHQTGLDADIWYTPPPRLDLSYAEREQLGAMILRTDDQKRVNGNWTRSHAALLKLAASDPRVERIFVA